MLTVREYAAKYKISQIMVYQALADNRVPGAIKVGKRLWRIPENSIIQASGIEQRPGEYLELLQEVMR